MGTPSNLAKLRAERREAIRDVQESWGDMTPPVYEPPPIHVHVDVDSKPNSDPPTSDGMAIGKHGVKLGKLPPWAVVLIAVVAIVAASIAYIATH